MDDPLYTDVIDLASRSYGLLPEELRSESDPHSEIYALSARDKVSGTITVTRMSRGYMESEEQFPRHLLLECGDQLCTAFRFAVDRSLPPSRKIGLLVIRVAAMDAASLGARISISATKLELLQFYRSLGFIELTTPVFTHKRLGTPHKLVALLANSKRNSIVSDLCVGLPELTETAIVAEYCLPDKQRFEPDL